METSSPLIRRAKECHTKQAWEQLFRDNAHEIRAGITQKNLAELAKLLFADSQSLQYDPEIWGILLDACMATWDLELGAAIARHVKGVSSVKVAIPSAKVYAEKGQPLVARRIANRALRLSSITSQEKLQLEMIACQSYVDEGKRNMAIKFSNRIQQSLLDESLTDQERAPFLAQLARTIFFLGKYPQAAKLFHDSYLLFKRLENWYEAARSVYNAGSSYFSAGGKLQESAFALIEECRRLSEAHDLKGPLSHVEAFYGHDDYWHGNFAGARDHYRRAHKYIPTSDKSFRTLHVLSMLTFIYLRTGQFSLAKKFGEKTLALAAQDQSQRFRSRYHNLKAEIIWESGEVEASQHFMREHMESLAGRGVNTLEELSTLSRYYLQCASLREDVPVQKIKISDQLKKNTGDWVEYLHALAKLHLAHARYSIARDTFDESLQRAKQYGDKYHTAISLLGLIQTALAQDQIDSNLDSLVKEFEISLARLVETPINVHTYLIRAALAYRQGDFDRVRHSLEQALSQSRANFCDRFVVEAWIATINGYAPKAHSAWQRALVAGMTQIYFKPTFEVFTKKRYVVSKHYVINLEHHPALNELLEFLLKRNKFHASPADIQTEVWRQSLQQQGWRQKIRNTITRLRDFVPYTLAPLILHDEYIALNCEAISIKPLITDDAAPKDEIMRLLREGPMSTVHLSNRLNVSSATTKRLLKRLSEEERITVMKVGRQVLYQSIESNQAL